MRKAKPSCDAEGFKTFRADLSVGDEPSVQLERNRCGLGVGSKDAVDASWREACNQEALLYLADVISSIAQLKRALWRAWRRNGPSLSLLYPRQ